MSTTKKKKSEKKAEAKEEKPKKIILKAKDFETRADLEAEVLKVAGDNLTLNRVAGHEIVGTTEELGKLQLSDSSSVYGFRTVTEEEPKKKDAGKAKNK